MGAQRSDTPGARADGGARAGFSTTRWTPRLLACRWPRPSSMWAPSPLAAEERAREGAGGASASARARVLGARAVESSADPVGFALGGGEGAPLSTPTPTPYPWFAESDPRGWALSLVVGDACTARGWSFRAPPAFARRDRGAGRGGDGRRERRRSFPRVQGGGRFVRPRARGAGVQFSTGVFGVGSATNRVASGRVDRSSRGTRVRARGRFHAPWGRTDEGRASRGRTTYEGLRVGASDRPRAGRLRGAARIRLGERVRERARVKRTLRSADPSA